MVILCMILTNLQTIKRLCRQYNLRPSRQNGQNFLIDKIVLDKLIQVADLKPTDTVLEVGAGFGVITKELFKFARRVIAVELDRKMIPIISRNVKNVKNLELVNADVLKLNFTDLGLHASSFKIIANLPYNITSHFLRQRLTQSPQPERMVLIVQREVAERICALAGKMSLLSVSAQFYSEPRLISLVPRVAFWPEPEVDSAIVEMRAIGKKREQPASPSIDDNNFFRLVRIGFSARRKMLKNNLANGLKLDEEIAKQALEKIGLDAKIRAQDLSVKQWLDLAGELADNISARS